MASGDVQVGFIGSTPLAAGITRGLPLETFFVAAEIGSAEALVVRDGSNIGAPQDLIGKKIAVAGFEPAQVQKRDWIVVDEHSYPESGGSSMAPAFRGLNYMKNCSEAILPSLLTS